jgi:hypothetical protein
VDADVGPDMHVGVAGDCQWTWNMHPSLRKRLHVQVGFALLAAPAAAPRWLARAQHCIRAPLVSHCG